MKLVWFGSIFFSCFNVLLSYELQANSETKREPKKRDREIAKKSETKYRRSLILTTKKCDDGVKMCIKSVRTLVENIRDKTFIYLLCERFV